MRTFAPTPGPGGSLGWVPVPVGSRSWRQDVRRVRNLLRRTDALPPAAPVPPPLPPGRVVAVAGTGRDLRTASPPEGGPDTGALLHGWAATADLNWWRSYEPLSRDRQVIAPDHPGHGRGLRTEARFTLERCADLAAGVLDALDIPRRSSSDTRWAARSRLRLWERHPDHVAALVLGATALTLRRTVVRPSDVARRRRVGVAVAGDR